MEIDFVHFYVEDVAQSRQWFVDTLGFQAVGRLANWQAEDRQAGDQNQMTEAEQSTETAVLQSGPVTFLLSAALQPTSPVAAYLNRHAPGVADVAFRVRDLAASLTRATRAGAKVLQPIQSCQTSAGILHWVQIQGWGGIRHTLLERQGQTPLVPGFSPDAAIIQLHTSPLTGVDHVVLNVAAGELQPALDWYQQTLGFCSVRRFEIATDRSGLRSQVLSHPEGGAQLPINEPTDSNSQIQEFLDLNRGPGIQHLALKTSDLVATTNGLRQRGLAFLETPTGYYRQLQQRQTRLPIANLPEVDWAAIREQKILVDWQESPDQGMLLQIFTQPIFSQPTFFLEFIERRNQAQGFGEGNFLALFAAIEQEQLQRQ